MKKTIKLSCILLLLAIGLLPVHAQSVLDSGIKSIKIGNSLREVRQFDKAKTYLERAYARVKGQSKYWEAYALESLGYLYRDINDIKRAEGYFKQAIPFYKQLGMNLSVTVIQTLINEIGGQAEFFAGIEVGGTGVKATVMSMVPSAEGLDKYESVFSKTINTTVVSCTPSAIAETLDAIQGLYKDSILTKYKVPLNNVFVVLSSGVQIALEKCGKLESFSNDIYTRINKKADILNPTEEACLLLDGTVPRKFWNDVSSMDVGGSNTKGAYKTSTNCEGINFPYGSKTMLARIQEKAKQENKTFTEAAKMIEQDFIQEVQAEFNRKPGFKNLSQICLAGGIVWAAATYLHPEESDNDFPRLSVEDIQNFRNLAMNDYEKLINPDISKLTGAKLNFIQRDIKGVKGAFNQETMIAGAIILNAVVKEYTTSKPDKRFYFGRRGVLGWLTGYIQREVSKRYTE